MNVYIKRLLSIYLNETLVVLILEVDSDNEKTYLFLLLNLWNVYATCYFVSQSNDRSSLLVFTFTYHIFHFFKVLPALSLITHGSLETPRDCLRRCTVRLSVARVSLLRCLLLSCSEGPSVADKNEKYVVAWALIRG